MANASCLSGPVVAWDAEKQDLVSADQVEREPQAVNGQLTRAYSNEAAALTAYKM